MAPMGRTIGASFGLEAWVTIKEDYGYVFRLSGEDPTLEYRNACNSTGDKCHAVNSKQNRYNGGSVDVPVNLFEILAHGHISHGLGFGRTFLNVTITI